MVLSVTSATIRWSNVSSFIISCSTDIILKRNAEIYTKISKFPVKIEHAY